MESLCEPKYRSCNTTTKYVSVYKSSIDVLSYMKLVELNIKLNPSSTISKHRNLHATCCSALQENQQLFGKNYSKIIPKQCPSKS